MNNANKAASELYKDGYITEKQLQDIEEYNALNIFSLNTELRALLYAGLLGITTGLGILVYKNIETIGHTVIISIIGLSCIACFAWCFKNSPGFSKQAVISNNPFFDYVLLAGCLLAGIFTAYLQYQYTVFGTHYGLETILPTALYFFCAYYFDHRGVLAMAITGLGAWLGITVSPVDLIHHGFTYDIVFSYIGIALGTGLVLYTIYAEHILLKPHFNFTYLNFALHLIFVGALSAMFMQNWWLLFLIPVIMASVYFIWLALKMHSFYFLVFTIIYDYIAVSYVVFKTLETISYNIFDSLFTPIYFIASCCGMIYGLIKLKKYVKE